jgi:hypothetical protein
MARMEMDPAIVQHQQSEGLSHIKETVKELLQTKLELAIEHRDMIGPLLKRINKESSRRTSFVDSIRSTFSSRKNSIAQTTGGANYSRSKFSSILWAWLSRENAALQRPNRSSTQSMTDNARLSTDLKSYKPRQLNIQDFEILKRISRGAYGYELFNFNCLLY